jgi:hypothetical protein
MERQTRVRTLSAVLVLIVLAMLNTLMQLANLYSEWFAWTLYGVAVVVIVVVLRFQQQLNSTVTAVLLAIPFVLAALAALIGI